MGAAVTGGWQRRGKHEAGVSAMGPDGGVFLFSCIQRFSGTANRRSIRVFSVFCLLPEVRGAKVFF